MAMVKTPIEIDEDALATAAESVTRQRVRLVTGIQAA
jgi:hypothetical protein